MRKTNSRSLASFLLALILVSLGFPAPLSAQTSPASPQQPSATNAMGAPPVLWIEREVVQPGKMKEHNDVVRKILEQYSQRHVVFRALGLTSVLPDSNEVLFLIHFNSFAEIDEFQNNFKNSPGDYRNLLSDLHDQESALHASKQSIATMFREDLSYRADAASVAKARYLWTCQFVVPAGHVPDFEADVKFLKAVYEKAGVDDHYFMYQELAGAESQTFLVLHPMKALADWDKAPAISAELAATLDDAGKQHLGRLWMGQVIQGPGESVDRLYVLRPDLSQTSDQFASFDPDFWHPKKQ
jgi:hypothetical protein